MLLPTESAKLLAKWQGPYEVVRKISEMDYEVNMVDNKKKLQVLHVNLLKCCFDRETLFGDCEEEELGPEVGHVKMGKDRQILTDDRIESQQAAQVRQIEREFLDVFSKKPGHTHLVEHSIET